MKRLFQWVMTATLICGATLLTACFGSNDNPVDNVPSTPSTSGIAMIVKNGQIDYWRQIETAFRGICQEKGLEAYYYSTSAETAYQEQVAAVAELRNLSGTNLKGIIFAPSYGLNGESAEAEVAALAKERGIPVIILDSPVSATSPLASYPYIGTDNTAAGQAMAEKVMADKVAAFVIETNRPGMERAEAFKKLKPNAVIYEVGDKATEEVKAVVNEYNDFVFFNGNALVDDLPTLKAPGKRVYTFDVYGEFLDELIAYSPYLKGVMAQNTFSMARKAVEAVLANATQGEMVPTFYITEDNLNDPAVKPFLEFYNKQVPAVIEDLAEKIIGKWILADRDGQPRPTNNKFVYTFVSPTKAYMSVSFAPNSKENAPWHDLIEGDVVIEGNKATLTFHRDEHTTLVHEFIFTDITANEFTANLNATEYTDGNVSFNVKETDRYVKVPTDYKADIVGTWQGHCTSEGSVFDDGQEHRWQYNADGTYVYYVKDGNNWVPYATNTLNEYFVDGNLLCTRWIDNGVENREWWEITINGNKMNWTALRQKEDGSTFTATFEMKKVQ